VPGAQIATDADADGDEDTLFLSFLDPGDRFRIELRLGLAGAPFGPPTAGAGSDLATLLTVVNTSGASLDFSLFEYTDVDLFNTFADDEALFSATASPNSASVTDSSGLAEYESVWTPRPTAVEAALYDATLSSLLDGGATSLSGALAAGPGDVTLAAVWQVLLAPDAALLVSQDQSIRVAPIPEPSMLVLLAGGLAGVAAARRRRRRAPVVFDEPEAGR
jgi:hypothetical protein